VTRLPDPGDARMTRPRLLDLFCGAGGAAMGYHRAGFDVVGVDINPQPHYPFEFHQGDAMTWPLDGFDAIHASPPCQAYSQASLSQRNAGKQYPDLVDATRQRLLDAGLPYVIENVPGAPIRPDFVLCGCQVGLELRRIRWFEVNWPHSPFVPSHNHTGPVLSVVGHGTPSWVRKQLGYNPSIADYRAAMGIDWMTRDELSQAIPPAYTQFIGEHLITYIERTSSWRVAQAKEQADQ
jgi:DNA (cytosine-5)-methyltransferase 1